MQSIPKNLYMEDINTPNHTNTDQLPLCVDLDGTLINTDTLHELILKLIKTNPFLLFKAIFWLLQSKSGLKAKLSQHVSLNVKTLPYNEEVISYIRSQKSERIVLLVTGCYIKTAEAVAEYLGLFEGVIATTDTINLTGSNKRDRLIKEFGDTGFEYIGNDRKDFKVWSHAKRVAVVAPDGRFLREVKKRFPNIIVFKQGQTKIRDYLKAIRIHQWSKNILIFVPLLLDQRIHDLQAFMQVGLGFMCLSLVASATYIINDLSDLDSDRINQYKKKRAFASGLISVKGAIFIMIAMLAAAAGLILILPMAFSLALSIYTLTTLAYTFYFKRIAILDVCILAVLFTIRVICGILIIGSGWSFWLLAFSMFLFFSLAMAKRVSELENIKQTNHNTAPGRGYRLSDIHLLTSAGISSGYLSILVVALYINSDKVKALYSIPEILWLLCPLLMYWVGRIWMKTTRGEMSEDPIVFAMRDKVSLLVFAFGGMIVMAAIFSSKLWQL
jgi:4-hydroxybenzoate polyprenyltransferase